MRALLGAGLALLAVALTAGCGTGGLSKGGDVSRGKTLFTQKCASCHVLADAGATGKVGPSLDDAFAGPRKQGFDDSTIQNVVRDQISIAAPPMPRNLVTGSGADAVAAYVAQVAGKPVQGGGVAAATTTAPAAPAAGGAARGKSLYSSLGCQACHSLDGSKGIGPTFKGLAGSQVNLVGGQTVTADDAFLLESILDPDKQIVSGYQAGVMSATIKPRQVAEADAKAIVDFIKSLK